MLQRRSLNWFSSQVFRHRNVGGGEAPRIGSLSSPAPHAPSSLCLISYFHNDPSFSIHSNSSLTPLLILLFLRTNCTFQDMKAVNDRQHTGIYIAIRRQCNPVPSLRSWRYCWVLNRPPASGEAATTSGAAASGLGSTRGCAARCRGFAAC